MITCKSNWNSDTRVVTVDHEHRIQMGSSKIDKKIKYKPKPSTAKWTEKVNSENGIKKMLYCKQPVENSKSNQRRTKIKSCKKELVKLTIFERRQSCEKIKKTDVAMFTKSNNNKKFMLV